MSSLPRVERTATTLADLLVDAAHDRPSQPAVVTPLSSTTYGQLAAGVTEVASGLLALGIGPRSHVGIFAPNGVAYVEALLATQLIGAVAVPMNVRNKTSELRFIIEHADLEAVLTTTTMDHHTDLAALIRDAFPDISTAARPEALDVQGAPSLTFVALLDGTDKPGIVSRRQLTDRGTAIPASVLDTTREAVRADDLAVILYTSGTTAHPKGCMLSHDALLRAPIDRARDRFRTDNDHEVFWIPGPLFHVGALSPYICCLAAGGTLVTDSYFDAGRAVGLLQQHPVTAAWPWFPVITEAVLDHADFSPKTLDRLRYLGQVGPRSLFERLRDLLPDVELVKSSGMTETAGSFGLSTPDETFEERVVYQGEPIARAEVKVVDPVSGDELPRGEVGHLLVRGECVTSGYYGEAALTAETLSVDGWLRTGDFYSHAASGKLAFHGRMKDMLRVGGENVAPMELEDFLTSHPAVHAAAVIGRPDARLDEVPVAFVELRAGARVEPRELIEFCVGRIASFKVPREIYLVGAGEWPTSATKIDKRALRSRLAGS